MLRHNCEARDSRPASARRAGAAQRSRWRRRSPAARASPRARTAGTAGSINASNGMRASPTLLILTTTVLPERVVVVHTYTVYYMYLLLTTYLLLLTYCVRGRTDKLCCRCFGAPACRVFPDHLITACGWTGACFFPPDRFGTSSAPTNGAARAARADARGRRPGHHHAGTGGSHTAHWRAGAAVGVVRPAGR